MIAGVSCWPRSRHSVNKIWSSVHFPRFVHFILSTCPVSSNNISLSAFVALGFYYTHTWTLFCPVYVSSPVQSLSPLLLLCLHDHFNQQDAGWHSLSHPPFHFVHLQINVQHVLIYGLLSFFYKRKHKRSFITTDTSCSM